MIEVSLTFLLLCYKYRGSLWGFDYAKLNSALARREARYGITRWGLLQTGLVMLAVFFYVRPASHCAFMGKYYAALAASPFGFDPSNPVPHRVLTSLISYLLGMHGHLIIVTNLLIAAALLFVIYTYFRRLLAEPAAAFLATATIAFSIVTLNTVYYGGYNDSLSYLVIFLMWALRKQRLMFYGLFLLGLLNRETLVFLLPWFAFISFEPSDSRARRLLELLAGFGLSLGLYLLFRFWLSQHQEIQYSAAYYLRGFFENPLGMFQYHVDNVGLGLFSVFKAMWLIPIAAALAMWRQRDRGEIVSLILLLLGSASQLLVAYDTTRLLTLGWMIMPISLLYLFRNDVGRVRQWILPVLVLNLLIPNLNIAGLKIEVMHSLLSYIIAHALR